jgi:Fic-DOC domain mobile mystery protein B
VSGALVPVGDGHTELTDDDRRGLIPTYIATRGELFDAEQRGIARALLGRRPTAARLLDDRYLRGLHRAMFGDVWTWAGKYRRTDTNIGVDHRRIPVAVRDLVDDARAQVELSVYPADELAARFHHRLVAIHPFPNGNGRHGRIAADLLLGALDQPAFTWGAGRAVGTAELRAAYRRALQRADGGEIEELLAFVRS